MKSERTGANWRVLAQNTGSAEVRLSIEGQGGMRFLSVVLGGICGDVLLPSRYSRQKHWVDTCPPGGCLGCLAEPAVIITDEILVMCGIPALRESYHVPDELPDELPEFPRRCRVCEQFP